ncbi:valine--tRNA ligase [Thermodesulfobacteriota bacterium]
MNRQMLDKSYEPGDVEKRWYTYWEEEGLFEARESNLRPAYSIVIPPPNVTGVLHMGHALNVTLQDILCRYRRLLGDNVLWMPGTDHAGIATQNVVEKQLASEGLDRHAVGREKFVERVWNWRREYGGAIIRQLKRLGASCDWQRERFTMDEGLSLAVRKVFVDLYNEGLIYRGDYIINWCPRCQTALADLEVEHEQSAGHLYHIFYQFSDGNGGVVIATTRPETMLGDTAVAVHPEDKRYADLHGTRITLPLMNREIPLIRDTYVDRDFGTGALKVTPAHDPNDFEIGLRHGLPAVKVIGEDGRMTEEAASFAGLERFECRKSVVDALERSGLLEKVESYDHSVGHCYRCKTIVEPDLSEQWFVRVKPLAEKAIRAVENGQTRIIPGTWARTYFDWMHNIRDWCISRQIWWGHRIPAWTCADCGEVTVAMQEQVTCPSCQGERLEQETDVLDTWFSSALWPFSTMGWPEDTTLLSRFYPTSVLVTGFDILFFWIARMMMMGIHFMGAVPFRDVYIHALVRDAEGKKMSKSKGNVIDPLHVIDTYGTDAFRLTLAALAAQGRDIRLSEDRIEGYRHFINKLWNAARFAIPHLDGEELPALAQTGDASLQDRWILSRLSSLIEKVKVSLDAYRFNDAAGALYSFVWHEFCDWYLEAVKPILYGGDDTPTRATTVAVLGRVFRDLLILLHPFIPFVTEELWHRLPSTNESIMKTGFPEKEDKAIGLAFDPEAEETMNLLMDIVTSVRNIRGEMGISPSVALDVLVLAPVPAERKALEAQHSFLVSLARLNSLMVETEAKRPRVSATAVVGSSTVFVSLEGIVDLAGELGRLEKETAKLAAELLRVEKKLANEDFLTKAPADVVHKVREQQSTLSEKRDKLQGHLRRVRSIMAEFEPQ